MNDILFSGMGISCYVSLVVTDLLLYFPDVQSVSASTALMACGHLFLTFGSANYNWTLSQLPIEGS
jgi:hypothetical protein